MTAAVFDATRCDLGEGPLWHPERAQLFWFDINRHALLTQQNGRTQTHVFDEPVSAAGWVDRDTALMASASGLWRLDLRDMSRTRVVALEADNAATRSNDGRADPWGGFWIGTMGRRKGPGEGAIYRYYRGEVRQLVDDVTISNAICFAPDRSCAYWCDTVAGLVWRQPLEQAHGWPEGGATVFLDARGQDWGADGAVVDAEGCLWNAQWGASRVARYAPDGTLLETHALPTAHASCPAFGGPNLTDLFVTTAYEDNEDDPAAGQTYQLAPGVTGQREHQVIL